MDTPGILWPKFEDQQIGLKLAIIGSINDEILQTEELALEAIALIEKKYPGILGERYNIETDKDAYKILEAICISRHCYQKGEVPDMARAAGILLEDLRGGRIGRITLEHPEEQ